MATFSEVVSLNNKLVFKLTGTCPPPAYASVRLKMKDILVLNSELFQLIQDVTISYVQKKYKHNYSGNGNDFIYLLRGSIQFRLEAVSWHYGYLLAQHKAAEEEYFSKLQSDEDWDHLLATLNMQFYIFDDIVFNLLSLYEYIGNLMGYLWKGEHGKALRWNGIAKSALDKSNEFSKFEVAPLVCASHRTLFSKLEDYRANIFHYKAQMGAVGSKFDSNLAGNPFKISIDAPDNFKKIFKGYSVDSSEAEILTYSKLAINNSFKQLKEILFCLQGWPTEPRPLNI